MSNSEERLILLGKQIQTQRKLKKISQLNLSVKLGITREHLSKIERGATYPSVKILFQIADILRIKLKDIIDF